MSSLSWELGAGSLLPLAFARLADMSDDRPNFQGSQRTLNIGQISFLGQLPTVTSSRWFVHLQNNGPAIFRSSLTIRIPKVSKLRSKPPTLSGQQKRVKRIKYSYIIDIIHI